MEYLTLNSDAIGGNNDLMFYKKYSVWNILVTVNDIYSQIVY